MLQTLELILCLFKGKVNIDHVVLKQFNISFRKVCVQDTLDYLTVRILIVLEIYPYLSKNHKSRNIA
jgi:hypothetical protein